MNRRIFLKGMMATAGMAATGLEAATLVARKEKAKPVVMGVDLASERDRSVVSQWGVDCEGGYMYSDELSAKLRDASRPLIRFHQGDAQKDAGKDYATLAKSMVKLMKDRQPIES